MLPAQNAPTEIRFRGDRWQH